MTITTTAGMNEETRTKVFNALRDGIITKKECDALGLDNVFASQLQNDFRTKKYVQIGDLAIFNRGTEVRDGKTYQRTQIEKCPTNEPKSGLAKLWDNVKNFINPSSNGQAYAFYDDPEAFTVKNLFSATKRELAEQRRREDAIMCR